ncbi:hypothetical protein D9758_016741 [Tetrapyrgos nigripes]|uniref:Uncharacterized protein n=1 Tax=Tetrapyrgos nigripes TaxID=182062 RepID=A0A8H5C7N0_9AGAR|nr:hypothetical protein D9758_016741 [Tetrapyrgos nigripes]
MDEECHGWTQPDDGEDQRRCGSREGRVEDLGGEVALCLCRRDETKLTPHRATNTKRPFTLTPTTTPTRSFHTLPDPTTPPSPLSKSNAKYPTVAALHNYSMPPGSTTSTATAASAGTTTTTMWNGSVSALPPISSLIMSAYKGRGGGDVTGGRPLDAVFLSSIGVDVPPEDGEEW